jgi:arginyl-tRNA synthetase
MKEEYFPLHKDRYSNRILYISGVALKLSKYENISSQEIARVIVSHFSATYGNEFKVQTVSPAWIHFELTAPALGIWLQSLAQESRDQGGREIFICEGESSLFSIQYAHARCCSLLRLARQEGLIPSSKFNPWLDSNHQLRLTHPASTQLIAELVQTVDVLECDDSIRWEKAALKLSQGFEIFWRKCQIFGEVKTTSPELTQARVGLVAATQAVLSFLLETKLAIPAPREL